VPYGAAEISSTKPEEELATLKSQEEWLQSTLSQVRQKIEELEAKPRQE
jgi:vacuolar-type H+-ATPase subunit E/Vma4